MKKPILSLITILFVTLIIAVFPTNSSAAETIRTKDGQELPLGDQIAIRTLVALNDAYSSHDPSRIKAIDLRTKQNSDSEVVKYFEKGNNFKLLRVDLNSAGENKINGIMLYTMEIVSPEHLGKTVNIAYTKFTLVKEDEKWMLFYAEPTNTPMFKLLELAENAEKKYGVKNLADLL